jgi:hypothetical protein
MHSRTATYALVGCLIFLGAAIEVYARWGFARTSKVQAVVEAQWTEARALRPSAVDGRPTVLLVGNSLLEAGIPKQFIAGLGGGQFDVHLLSISNTQAIDWEFALRRLVREGSRPSVVVLVVGAQHLWGTRVNGSYFAHYMLSMNDWPQVVGFTKASAEQASELLLANRSAWLGSRAEFRIAIAEKIFPGMKSLAVAFLSASSPSGGGQTDAIERCVEQLTRIRDVLGVNAVSFRLIVMPGMSGRAQTSEIVDRLTRSGLSLMDVASCSDFAAEQFSDGFHLNADGAELFVRPLGEAIRYGWFGDGGARFPTLPSGCIRQ